MNMKKNLTQKKVIRELKENREVLKKYTVKKIGLFGSFVQNRQKVSSDIDFVVEFNKPSFDNLIGLIDYLEKLFDRKVDVLTSEGVKNIRVKKVAEDIKRNLIYA
ncbi:nucleotidyltransferase domain-containing protein [bacterium]|nr:nucleotidyltransferase [Candidatus Omnitrophota bacterium]MBA3066392.1 nucleotidyltransferase [bacterium]MBU2529026.1 nucleotidyltransferase domain-containing protein [bacterium]MBU3930213.1 nucleotidyltransferase domain-containing protein [bacterium]MBU4122734.1 nucleotidyltransferase domain-containing protein [bacterium]